MSVHDRNSNEDTRTYKVLMNHEEQYCIWLDHKEIPLGWKDVEKRGPKAECLAYIKEVWTDMRPLSLRKKMKEFAEKSASTPQPSEPCETREKSLVDLLCEGDHQVEVRLRPEKTVKLFKDAIDRSYIHIRFPHTQGGTELGFSLNQKTSDFSTADFSNGKGTVHVEGELTLDYVKVKCVANIDLSTLEGKGYLVKIEPKEGLVAARG